MSAASLMISMPPVEPVLIPSIPALRRARHPVVLADFPPRDYALSVGRSLVYRQGRLVVINDAPGDLFNQRADLGLA